MDILKRQRTLLRSVFTRNVNSIKELFENDPLDLAEIEVSFNILQQKADELQAIDKEIRDLLLNDENTTENDFLAETTNTDKYVGNYESIRLKVQKILKQEEALSQVSSNNLGLGSDANYNSILNKRTYRLPKIEIKKFDGELINWLPFWSQFEKIDIDPSITPADKFQYLLQCIVPGTRAYEVVQSFPPIGPNYSKVTESLKTRFGKDDLLVEVYVRELLKIVLTNSLESKNQMSLQALYDKLESHLRNLETLGVTTDKCASLLYPMVESCMPEDLLRAWQRSSHRTGKSPQDRLNNLMKFMLSEVESEQRIGLAMSGFGTGINSNHKESKQTKKSFSQTQDMKPSTSTAASLVSFGKYDKSLICIFCEKSHKSSDCFSAQKMALDEKTQIIKEKRCCFCCLKPGHSIKQCKSSLKCPLCKKRHFVVMCPNFHVNINVSRPTNMLKPEAKVTCAQLQDNVLSSRPNHSNNVSHPRVFMQTLIANLRNPNTNTTIPVRLLFDIGSERSYIAQTVACEIEYKSLGQERIVHSLFGNVKTAENIHNKYRVHLSNKDDSYRCNFEVLSQPKICGNINHVTNGPWLKELVSKGIHLTDIEESNLPISILIGADVAGKLYTGDRLQLDSGLVAMNTLLGWTLMGKVPGGPTDLSDCLSSLVTSMFIQDANIANLWNLDLIGIKEPPEHQSVKGIQMDVQDHFLQTTIINKEGRYEVKLPFIDNHPPLPTNKVLAEKRLQSVCKRLKNKDLFSEYDSVFKDWKEQGIIEIVPSDELDKDCHYLPHRPVVKESSQTTRIRPVFDASARDRNQPSLNDCLECGPNLIELIPTVMLRFREGRFGVVADIAKAFLQIAVNGEDIDKLRFLWYNSNDEIIVYRHKRVVFGVKCSPFLLGAVIDLHLQKATTKLSGDINLVQKLQKSFYVDNVSTSVNTVPEVDKFIAVATRVMAEGKFDLRGWIATGKSSNGSEPSIVNVLGVKWDYQNDQLFVGLDYIKDFDRNHIIKREILSVSHRIFDPLGFISPVMLYPKLLLQKMWDKKIDWDTDVEPKTAERFLQWFDELLSLQYVKIPRWLGIEDTSVGCTIHTFCDASKDAYAAVIFLRVETENKVTVQLLASKSRVAPLKSLSIPRLELLAATVGVRLTETIVKSLNWQNIPIFYWTDSTTVLGWIRQECNWKVFVWNRVSEIKKLSKVENWNYIKGEFNPADLPSRGCDAQYFLKSKWWEGPEWLKFVPEEWPTKGEINLNSEEIEKEKRLTETKCMINNQTNDKWYSDYFSKFKQNVRLIAWIYRFAQNCKTEKDLRMSGEITADETIKAERTLLNLIQQESFNGVNDKNISCLDPFIDENGLIRLKTKLCKKEDAAFGVRFPILLPAHHPTVKALILDCHVNNCHAGVQILLNILRDKYWILGGRKTVRNAISKCVKCKRQKSQKMEPITGTLPMDRMKDCSVFEVTGSDFAGPLYLKKKEKAWICIFTCAVYRAVHFELVTSLSSESFLQALRRFIARRGRPATIYSDNGTNYVGARNLLEEINWDDIKKFSSANHIKWKMIPPASPWWGGWWERIVRILKELLRRTLGRASLSYQEMITILCDCEAVINSRPLTYIYDGLEELLPLTPNHFLQDLREIGVPDLDQLDETSLNRRLKYLRTLKQELRERFKQEYLGQLTQRINLKKRDSVLQVGDVVLIECNNLKRVDWPLAVVVEVMPDKEGVIRVAKVKTSQGTLTRPVQKLYHLEISSKESEVMKRKANSLEEEAKINYEENKNIIKTRSGRIINKPNKYDI